jgi:pSer/pThr/pTyr-binding forkhead associated (FHA) protein
MITCPNCQTKHPEKTIFCDKCGTCLLEDSQKKRTPLAVGKVIWMGGEETSEVPEEEIAVPLGLKLTIPGSGRDVEVPLTEEVNIGRLDPNSNSFPEVDLTHDGGLEKGVSRRHARITRQGNEIFIEDLGSLNGTFLNRKRLIPHLPQTLKSGDELQLGTLTLRVSFTQ